MKKVLLASTALVFTGGMAFAEVSISGSGEFGVTNNGGLDGDDFAFTSEVGFSFSGTGETDGGISFGGALDADDSGDDGSSGTVFIEGAFGKLTVGDADSAADAAVGGLSGIGLTGLESEGVAFLGAGDTPTALYEYSVSDFTFYVSVSNPGATVDAESELVANLVQDPVTDAILGVELVEEETSPAADSESDWAVGADYSFGNYTFAIGYEEVDDDDHIVGSVSAAFGPATVKIVYGDAEIGGEDDEQVGISVDYVAGVTTITGFYIDGFEDTLGEDFGEEYGIGVAYDLGGGAVIQGGILDGDNIDDTRYDLGLSLSF